MYYSSFRTKICHFLLFSGSVNLNLNRYFCFLPNWSIAMTKLFSVVLFLVMTTTSWGQRKTLFASRASESIVIDGDLSDAAWSSAEIATDFIMYQPDNGKPIEEDKTTIVRILYDDEALYVAAMMRDPDPATMLKEVTQRDNFGTSEHFGIFINGFNDGQQEFRFFVSAADVQMDCVTTEVEGEDYSWDAIWDSKAKINEEGWAVEMKIPYAALRFSNASQQVWGINFYREYRRLRQQYTWQYINAQIGAELTQTGILRGIENIKPPLRLFLIPYMSYYYNDTPEGRENLVKGGLDIKYGINESFTVDAILVPDFGQTRFDNVELNLGPFEQQFIENRPFFTEGTDLFRKGNLLYTRRIGGSPSTFAFSEDPDIEISNPATVNLINALKLSGRTKGGLGIGVLNAVTERTYANAVNLSNGERSKILVEPLANFNVMVFDQRFNNNSSVTFVNTNVTRDGEFRDANVSALLFDLNTKENTYKLAGDFKYSYINEFGDAPNRDGFSTTLLLGETSGKYRYETGGLYVSRDYEINDLGINFMTDYHGFFANASYRILNPTKILNSFSIFLNNYAEFNNPTGKFQQANIDLTVNATTVQNDYFGLALNVRPIETFDFYEPRIPGRYVFNPRLIGGYLYFSSNYNRRFAIDIQPQVNFFDEYKRQSFGIYIEPRYRFSDKIGGNIGFQYARNNNNFGYIDDSYMGEGTPYEIYFARRNRTTYIFSAGGKYTVNRDMAFNLTARYYWSYADNRRILALTDDGYLIPADDYTLNRNSDFNTWNLDLSYSWWFAPGSQLTVLYRNNSDFFTRELTRDIQTNFNNLFGDNLAHIFSVSIRYFIDYNQAKKWF